MLYYIYYGYVCGYTVYKIYKYISILRYGYKTVYYTYSLTSGIYNMLPPLKNKEEELENLEDWEYIDLE
jgi:hypothetical protein